MHLASPLRAVLLLPLVAATASGQWSVAVGGDAPRSGGSTEVGPTGGDLLWDGSLAGIVAQQGVSDGDLVVVNRIASFTIPTGTWIVAHELETGAIRWQVQLPMNFADSWRSRVTGIRDGQVYASRSGNTNAEYLYALSETDGSILWESEDLVTETSTESVTFAPNGDVITSGQAAGGGTVLLRIDRVDGSTVWSSSRSCPTSGGCDPAVFGDKVYVFEASFAGPKITAFDLTTGARLYSSADLGGGFIQQVGPFVGPDGTVYAPRTANSPGFDFLFALEDTGSGFSIRWQVPMGYVPFASHGVGPDGSIYSYDLDRHVMRLDPATGAVLDRSADPITTESTAQPRMAVDGSGKVFLTNGSFAGGELLVYTPDLRVIWSSDVTNVNVGGPVLADEGTLIVCGVGSDVRAYRSDCDAYTVDYGTACVGSGGIEPSLTGSGCPEPGGSFTLSIADFLGGAPAFLGIGAGPETLSLPIGCDVQIAPTLPGGVVPLVLPGVGPGGGGFDLTLDVPPGVPVLDLFFQVFAVDAGAPIGVSASGAVQVHVE